MSLILALGSNVGDSKSYLETARLKLSTFLIEISASKVYQSEPVDYLDQPYFLNQVIEFQLPNISARECLLNVQKIEFELGRDRTIPKGPRTIDIDIIFWDMLRMNEFNLTLPHPRWSERIFITELLKELPFYQKNKEFFLQFPLMEMTRGNHSLCEYNGPIIVHT